MGRPIGFRDDYLLILFGERRDRDEIHLRRITHGVIYFAPRFADQHLINLVPQHRSGAAPAFAFIFKLNDMPAKLGFHRLPTLCLFFKLESGIGKWFDHGIATEIAEIAATGATRPFWIFLFRQLAKSAPPLSADDNRSRPFLCCRPKYASPALLAALARTVDNVLFGNRPQLRRRQHLGCNMLADIYILQRFAFHERPAA